MTEDELRQIEERERKATGKWEDEEEELDFVTHAREDIPALVAEVRRLRAGIQAFSDSIDKDVEEGSLAATYTQSRLQNILEGKPNCDDFADWP